MIAVMKNWLAEKKALEINDLHQLLAEQQKTSEVKRILPKEIE